MKPVDLRVGSASSIGSLPHTDPREAALFVLAGYALLVAGRGG